MYKMTQEEKIDYMIQSLKLAKEEIAYAKEYNEQKAKGMGTFQVNEHQTVEL